VIVLCVNATGQTLPDIQLLNTGFFCKSEIQSDDGDGWIGLFYKNDYSELRSVSVLKKEPHIFPPVRTLAL
jgi:hypothetical protein